MKPAHHHSRPGTPRGGFSLLEIIVVLAIIAVMFTAAISMVTGPQEEGKIREVHNDIEDLARQAREMSFSYQQPFVVEFREGTVLMKPLASPDSQIVGDLPDAGTPSSGLRDLNSMKWPRTLNISSDYSLSILRWGQRNFLDVSGETLVRWIHTPNTPCEPLVIKIISRDGNTMLSRKYHPLTAVASDDELEIRKP